MRLLRSAKPRSWRAPDGERWLVVTRLPGASGAMVVFQRADRTRSAEDRYAWWVTDAPESRDVTARLDARDVLASLDDTTLARLLAQSHRIGGQTPGFETA